MVAIVKYVLLVLMESSMVAKHELTVVVQTAQRVLAVQTVSRMEMKML